MLSSLAQHANGHKQTHRRTCRHIHKLMHLLVLPDQEVLEDLGGMTKKPKAIVVISAHWEETNPTVVAAADPGLLYDYYGFPDYTYAPHLTYPVKGDPALAARIMSLLEGAGLHPGSTTKRGFDHGVFIPLKLIFPQADIPVVQVSLMNSLDPARHVELGRALAPLRREGVLIVSSGSLTHNMRVGVSAAIVSLSPLAVLSMGFHFSSRNPVYIPLLVLVLVLVLMITGGSWRTPTTMGLRVCGLGRCGADPGRELVRDCRQLARDCCVQSRPNRCAAKVEDGTGGTNGPSA